MKKICVIFDLNNDISISSSKYIYHNISSKYEVDFIYKTFDDRFYLVYNPYLIESRKHFNLLDFKKYDLVFPLVDNIIGLLESFNIKFIGPSNKNKLMIQDKVLIQELFKISKIRQANFISINKNDKYNNIRKIIKYKIKYPCNVITSKGHIFNLDKENNLKRTLEKAFRYDDKIIVKHIIKGKILNVDILGHEHIISKPYDINNNNIIHNKINKQIKNISNNIYNKLECSGLVNIKYIISKKGKLYIEDINNITMYDENNVYSILKAYKDISNCELIDNLIYLAENK